MIGKIREIRGLIGGIRRPIRGQNKTVGETIHES
jgi:hypothetical protein